MSEQTTILADGTEHIAIEITSVRYDRLINLGNYENEKLGVSVVVPERGDPQAVVAAAKAFVEGELTGKRQKREEAESIEYRLQRLRSKQHDIEGKISQLEGIWRQAATMLAQHGITPETAPSLQWHWPALPTLPAEQPLAEHGREVEDDDDDDYPDEGPGARY